MARSHTGHSATCWALRSSYHGATFGAQSRHRFISGFRHKTYPHAWQRYLFRAGTKTSLFIAASFGEAFSARYPDEIDRAIDYSTSRTLPA